MTLLKSGIGLGDESTRLLGLHGLRDVSFGRQ